MKHTCVETGDSLRCHACNAGEPYDWTKHPGKVLLAAMQGVAVVDAIEKFGGALEDALHRSSKPVDRVFDGFTTDIASNVPIVEDRENAVLARYGKVPTWHGLAGRRLLEWIRTGVGVVREQEDLERAAERFWKVRTSNFARGYMLGYDHGGKDEKLRERKAK